MKQGKTLQQLAAELERIKNESKDFVVPSAKLVMTEDAKVQFKNGKDHEFELTSHAHGQLASYTQVPKQYTTTS